MNEQMTETRHLNVCLLSNEFRELCKTKGLLTENGGDPYLVRMKPGMYVGAGPSDAWVDPHRVTEIIGIQFYKWYSPADFRILMKWFKAFGDAPLDLDYLLVTSKNVQL